MTTSYKLDAIKELKAQKKLARAQEAEDLKEKIDSYVPPPAP